MNALYDILESKWGRAGLFAIRLFLGIVFIHSGLGKIVSPTEFAADIVNYRILPIGTVNIFALTLPWVELMCGLMLVNGIGLRSGALLVALMNVMFIGAAASALARGLDIECGCRTLASSSGKVGLGLIIRDMVLLILCLPFIFQPTDRRNKEPEQDQA